MSNLTYIKFYSKAKDLKKSIATSYGLPQNTPKILSNFYIIDSGLSYRGLVFDSVEHAFQYEKFLCVKTNKELAEVIAPNFIRGGEYAENAAAAKSAGTKGSFKKMGLELDVDLWKMINKPLMEMLIKERFIQDALFRMCLEICWKHEIKLYHHGRSIKDVWCCHVKDSEGTDREHVDGLNQLGNMMMDLSEMV